MDLYDFLSVQAFFLVPFVVYFLVFKKNDGRSLYSNRDFFYPIKFLLAKRVVKCSQAKSRTQRRNMDSKSDLDVTFLSKECSHYQTFNGCDQKGNGLSLKFILRSNKVAEVALVLRLANGSIYSFPGLEKVHVTSIKENQWKIKGLLLENLEPYERVRIVFNGLLQNVSCKRYEKIEHVQFNFIFNCCSAPKFFPDDGDTNLLAETLAARAWRNASWKEFLSDQSKGYEQFGSLLGVIKGDSFPEECILNLPSCRSKYSGYDDSLSLDRELNVFLAENYGVLINLRIKSLEEGRSQLNYGYVIHGNNVTVPITGQDIRLKYVGSNKSVPDMFLAHINTKTKEYICVFNLNKDTTCNVNSQTGYEIFNVYGECDINTSQGRALVQFVYYNDKSDEKLPPLKSILSEKKVNVLPEDFVTNIKSEKAKILEITGGKGNSLALLSSITSKEEFLVPDGFILTINAFKHQVSNSLVLQKTLKNLDDVFCGRKGGTHEETCAETVRMFKNEQVHPDVAKDIVKSLREVTTLSFNDSIDVVSWAVRSSAIGEDSEELSAAGQNETILGCVTDKEVLEAVCRCWASLFSYQSVQYRWQHGLPIISDMAVVVQKMVPADSAGVLFTWHPSSSNPSQMVISSCFGLGESVVSGQTDSDTFILNRTHDGQVCLLDQIIGLKPTALALTGTGVKIVRDEDGSEFEVVNPEFKANKERWSISKEQAIKLGRVGVALEEAFGGHRDVEWAFYKGELYLLQSRPITTLNTWSDFEISHECDSPVITENSVFTMGNVGEVFPQPCTSLTFATTVKLVDRGLQKFVHGDIERSTLRSLCTFQKRVMLDVVLLIHKNCKKKTIKSESKILDLAIFGHPVLNERINQIVINRLGEVSPMKVAKEMSRIMYWSGKTKEITRKSESYANNLDFGIRDGDSAKDIYDKIDKILDELYHMSYYHGITTNSSVFYQIVTMNILLQKKDEFTIDHYTDFASILSSCEDVVSAEVPMFLERIARIIRDEGYNEEFCTIKPEFGVDWLKTKCPEAFRVFEEFLDKHGHRNLGEFELLEESWGMNPSKVIPMIQANAMHQRKDMKPVKSTKEVVANLASPINLMAKFILKLIMSKLRSAVGLRERTKSSLIRSINKLRIAYGRLGKEMVLQGLLPSEKLIFHLTHYELGEVINKRSPLLISKAVKRQRMYPKWSKLKFSEILYGFPEPEKEDEFPIELMPGSKCTGTPVCTGNVQARACVITSLDEIAQLQTGDILITYSTDIGWSPYFPMLTGVVTELGGLVSHGAVVAREYGLPCIVGVKNVTKMFKTGDIVFLSGKTGELGKL